MTIIYVQEELSLKRYDTTEEICNINENLQNSSEFILVTLKGSNGRNNKMLIRKSLIQRVEEFN